MTKLSEDQMDLRQISPDLAVAPQIDPRDLAAVAAAGFVGVIDNRPDAEIGPAQSSARMAEAAAQAGLQFHYLPVGGPMTPALVQGFADAMAAAGGPVLAYCRSGTRSATVWAITQAGKRPADEILRLAARAGYDLSHLRAILRG